MTRSARVRDFLSRHWAGQLLTAAFLPSWLLLLATSDHAPRPLASFADAILTGITVLAGLLVVGVWLWSRDRPGAFEQQIKTWTQPIREDKSYTSAWSLLGAAAFFAGGLQVLMDFDIFRRLLAGLGVASISAWESLLTLCAIQLACFFAHSRWLNRP